MIGLPMITQAMPGAKVLITDNPNHKVIEVDPTTNNVVWEYGGSPTLRYPNEAIPLTNGNILIADTYNGRIIEVTSDTKQIVGSYSTGLIRPVDVKRCVDYTTGTPRDTLLITDFAVGGSKVLEVTYPGGALVWELLAMSIGGTGDYLFWEAEKRPGNGTPTYLITCRSWMGKDSVIEVQQDVYPMVTWRYGYDPGSPTQGSSLNDPRDANWTPCGNVLITDTDNQQVIEVQPTPPFGGNIVWGVGSLNGHPYESIRIENGNTLVVEAYGDDNKDGIYVGTPSAIWEFRPDMTYDWWYFGTQNIFVDIEAKGIINIAKIEYMDMNEKVMPKVFAGVVVPIFQPEIVWVGTPTIVATKTVTPRGAQRPGTILTYTIELRNTGNGTATAVMVTDQVPDGTRYDVTTKGIYFGSDNPEANKFSNDGGVSWEASENEFITHLRWLLGNLAPNESRTLEFSVVIQP